MSKLSICKSLKIIRDIYQLQIKSRYFKSSLSFPFLSKTLTAKFHSQDENKTYPLPSVVGIIEWSA